MTASLSFLTRGRSCAPILQGRPQRAHVVERRLIVRFHDLEARVGGVAIHLRDQATAVQRRGAIVGRLGVVTVRARLADGGDVFVRQRFLLTAGDAELCFDLLERAVGAFEGQRELTRLEADQCVARFHFRAELHGHRAHDAGHLAADFGLIRRNQRAGQIRLAFDRHPLDAHGFHGHRGVATAAASAAPATAGGSGGLAGRGAAGGQRGRNDCDAEK
jgi:hypothetical protein